MRKFILSLSLSVLFVAPTSFALAAEIQVPQEAEKIEITHKQIPEEAKMDIIENYNGAEILKAYKEVIDGEIVGYQVQIKKGPKIWDVIYDKDGNPKNKLQPE